ncbi:hypothetical protein HanIR_Chr02g0086541 [Helianthus annuus]|nr:hypothetical protein HanIR_Chr02g0086541 [Helianthus annuus]
MCQPPDTTHDLFIYFFFLGNRKNGIDPVKISKLAIRNVLLRRHDTPVTSQLLTNERAARGRVI